MDMARTLFVSLCACAALCCVPVSAHARVVPALSELSPVTTPTAESEPAYAFVSDIAGTITYGGSCTGSATEAIVGENNITFGPLAEGTYSDCTITVTDTEGGASEPLAVSRFVVDQTAPQLVVPDGVSAAATSADGAAVSFDVTATDETDGDVSANVACTMPDASGRRQLYVTSGSTFPIGTSHVTCFARDAAGNVSGSSTFAVEVHDAVGTVDTVTDTDSAAVEGTADTWQWVFRVTLPFTETLFAMQFSDFTHGTDTIPVAGNLSYYTEQTSGAVSADTAVAVTAADTYPDTITLDGDADASAPGRQVDVHVVMRVPADAAPGSYTTTYGVQSDAPRGGGGGGFSGGSM